MDQDEPRAKTAERTVLVVEDEALLLFTIADDLREAGFKVFEATNAAAAIRMIEAVGHIDVLFTDVDMPGGMDGLTLAGTVRERWPETGLVITSGHVNLKQADLPPGGRFISKPYTPQDVVAAIETARG